MALKRGIKHFWIGARTTVNPFSVQEIVDALKGEDVAVMIKNPIHADLNLWVGTIERFINAGIDNLAAIHRGFSSFMNSEYRNIPLWKIPIELQRRFSELPIICDPSHIAGNRDLLFKVAQKAFDLNMAGIMMEVHPDPDKALSDPLQQVTPDQFLDIQSRLMVRKEEPTLDLLDQLEELRNQIDKVDEDLLATLAARFDLIKQIGEHKLDHNVAILQLERWNEILKSRSKLATKLTMDNRFIQQILELIHQESIRIQSEINSSNSVE